MKRAAFGSISYTITGRVSNFIAETNENNIGQGVRHYNLVIIAFHFYLTDNKYYCSVWLISSDN
jgi:hypothetical protein